MLAITPDESKRTSLLAVLFALALHVAFIAVAARLRHAPLAESPPRITAMFEIEAPPPTPQPVPEAPLSRRVQPAPAAAPRAHRAPAQSSRAAQSPLPEPTAHADDVLDFGSMLVTSQAASSFGVRASDGASARGAHSASSARGDGANDLSRAPALAGARTWRCPFPREADDAGIDHAVVTLRIDVAITGEVLAASALDDPGHGFAQTARTCALRKRFAPALDRRGTPQRAVTTVHVTFDR